MTPHESPPRPPLEERWRGTTGERYGRSRFASARAAGRDPALVSRALDRHGGDLAAGPILDVPCGAGRLRAALEQRGGSYVGVDVSEEMLERARGPGRVRASAWALPFPDDAFGAVVCCRLMHHLGDEDQREDLARELVRVSRDLVVTSFWDAASLHAWRRRAGLRRAAHPDRRVSIGRERLAAHFEAAGARVLGFEYSLRFVSQQAFLTVRKGT